MTYLNPDSKADLVAALEAVADDAEERARTFREYVESLSEVTGDEVMLALSQTQFAYEAQQMVDKVAHVHTGSTHGRRVREAVRVLFRLQSHAVRSRG